MNSVTAKTGQRGSTLIFLGVQTSNRGYVPVQWREAKAFQY